MRDLASKTNSGLLAWEVPSYFSLGPADGIRRALTKKRDEQDAGDKATDVCPERDASPWPTERWQARDKLNDKPPTKNEKSGNGHGRDEETEKDERSNSGSRI